MKTALLALGLSLPIAGAASAITFHINLAGAEEVPPTATGATGLAQVMFDPGTVFIDINGTFNDFSSPVTVGHLHGLADFGETASPIFAFVIDGDPDTGFTNGSFSGSTFLTQEQADGLLAGLTYINIHSEDFPGGEIRGQVVPAPAGAALLGAAGLFGLRRRR